MSKTQEISIMKLEQQYEDYMLKIGKEKFLEYYGSSFDDLYIIMQIEHDGVRDIALVDFLTDTVTMRVYDEYKFIIVDQWKVTTEVFNYLIDEQKKYFERVKHCIENGVNIDGLDE